MSTNLKPDPDPPLATAPSAAVMSPTHDRRGTPRVHTVCLNVKIERGGKIGLFRARNISDSGIMLHAHETLVLGERVLIHLGELSVPGTVSWCDAVHCGIRFDTPIDSTAMLHAGAERKRSDRRGGGLRLESARRATSYSENGIRAVRIADVSHRGIGLLHDGSLERGMSLKLVVDSGIEREAAVCWATKDRAGIRLAEPLSWAELGLVTGSEPEGASRGPKRPPS